MEQMEQDGALEYCFFIHQVWMSWQRLKTCAQIVSTIPMQLQEYTYKIFQH